MRDYDDFLPGGSHARREMPCDLPLEGAHFGRAAAQAVGGRRVFVLIVALAALLLALVAVLLYVRGCGAKEAGEVFGAAGSGAHGVVAEALSSAQDVQARAARGEGLIPGVVCIDPGHGGGADLSLTPVAPGSSQMQYVEPGGTSGVATGRSEAEVVLEIAQRLEAKLVEAGVTVVMVRTDNDTVLSSEQRAVIANEAGADLFVRLHIDGAGDPSARGFSTLVPGYNEWTADIYESSAAAAYVMHPIVVEAMGSYDRGVIERGDLAGFNFCDVPSVLFEMGFMSNYEEDVLLSDPEYQERLAQAFCDATLAYLEAVSG